MIETTTTELVTDFDNYLASVQRGETVLIRKQGRRVAKLVPDLDLMDGSAFAKLFSGYTPDALDKAAADEIERNIREMDEQVSHDLDH